MPYCDCGVHIVTILPRRTTFTHSVRGLSLDVRIWANLTFLMISNWKKNIGLHGLYNNISALLWLISSIENYKTIWWLMLNFYRTYRVGKYAWDSWTLTFTVRGSTQISESDVSRRQILTTKDGHLTERIKIFLMALSYNIGIQINQKEPSKTHFWWFQIEKHLWSP